MGHGAESALRRLRRRARLADRPDQRSLRRLQLAAETGNALAVLYRPRRAADTASPAALRLELEPTATGLHIRVLKRRGGWHTTPLLLAR